MKFEILINYTTGDSFGSEDREGEDLGLVFDTEALAIQALNDISEHYKAYREEEEAYYANSPYARHKPGALTKEQIRENIKSRPWFTEEDYWQFSISLQTSESGERSRISPFYVGYFETLNRAYAQPLGGGWLSVDF